MQNKELVAGIVVLYNPDIEEIFENINTYIDYLDCLYCIDNSNEVEERFINVNKVKYIPLGKNTGLANALSVGCDMAISDGAKILVTVDQDTIFSKDSLSKLIASVRANHNIIATPNIKRITRDNGISQKHEKPMFPELDTSISWAFTSGSVFTDVLYKTVGGFDKSLFIGQIDQDFCTAAKQKGYEIKRIGNSFIYQELGNAKEYNLLGLKKGYAPNLSPMRYYYVFRNEKYLRDKWGVVYKPIRVALYKYFFVVLLFEKNKCKKIKNMFLGYLDGWDMKGNHNENIC